MSQPEVPSALSGLKFRLPTWRYLLLFQSWSQFKSWAIVVLVSLVVISGLLSFAKGDGVPMEGILVGAVLGSLCSVLMVLPAEFEFKPGSGRRLALLQGNLEKSGYIESPHDGNSIVYRPNLPKWLRWDENKVFVQRESGSVIVKAPFPVAWKFRRALAQVG